MRRLFSIITPCYNSLKGLRSSFESVMAQDSGLYEYIIIDGASTDGTRQWLEEQDSARCRWISERDSGVYDAMNKGIAQAGGQFLYFLGAGDLLRPHILSDAARLIERLPREKPRFLYGNVQLMNQEGRKLGRAFDRRRFFWKNISHQGIFYDRAIFDLLGYYDVKYPVYADWAFNIRCFGDKRIFRYYWDHVIADFEGNGLSDYVQDLPFGRDHFSLIRQNFGRISAIQYKLEHKARRLGGAPSRLLRRWRKKDSNPYSK